MLPRSSQDGYSRKMSSAPASADAQGQALGWRIPRKALALSVIATLVLGIPAVAGFAISGVTGVIGVFFGALVALRPALGMRPLSALGLSIPGALTAAVAVTVTDQPVAAASFVALCCLLVAPANGISDGLLAAIPSVAAVLVATTTTVSPAAMIGWMLVGSLVAITLGHWLGPLPMSPGIDSARSWRHAAVMALAVGAVTYVVLAWHIPHGYWVALTLTVVLRPVGDGTRDKAWARVLGTIGGATAAVVVAPWLPPWAIYTLVTCCVLLAVGYAITKDYARQIAFVTPPLVLLDASPETTGLERIGTTIAGALLAAVIALALTWWENRDTAPKLSPDS
ncbi:MAG TPA: hypothetical protein DCM67_12290 [Propionibacteriaceae bacterium]|nr:hypothetical protein [Propionibacteriaceae bacterium]